MSYILLSTLHGKISLHFVTINLHISHSHLKTYCKIIVWKWDSCLIEGMKKREVDEGEGCRMETGENRAIRNWGQRLPGALVVMMIFCSHTVWIRPNFLKCPSVRLSANAGSLSCLMGSADLLSPGDVLLLLMCSSMEVRYSQNYWASTKQTWMPITS